MNIFDDPKFFTALEQFVFTNDKKFAGQLSKFKSKIPGMFRSAPSPIFRGMVLPKSLVFDIENGENLVLNDYSSWTDNEKMAIKFVNDPSKRVTGPKKKEMVGVIFKKIISSSKIIVKIQALAMYLHSVGKLDEFGFDELNAEMAMEEAEILCDKGIALSKKDIFKTIKL